jgi:phosphoglycerate dehydrogenase-like enzyme
MSNKILVTDSLFIFDEHIKKLQAAGFEVERLDTPKATEEELVEAVKGKIGYILGGIESVSSKVIAAADELEAIVFTGTAWDGFILDHDATAKKGIKVAHAPHANASAVAQWVFAAGVGMVRNLFALGRTGDKTFQTVPNFEELNVGVVGLGHVGAIVADLFAGVGFNVSYWSNSKKQAPYLRKELDALLKESDIVCFCVSSAAGENFIDAHKLSQIKDGAIVTSVCEEVLNEDDLLAELESGRLRAFTDFTPANPGFKKLSFEAFYCSNETAAYNTAAANQMASDWATDSIINLLTTGEDKYRVL